MRVRLPFTSRRSAAFFFLAMSLCLVAPFAVVAQSPPMQARAAMTKENILASLRALTPERRDAGAAQLVASIRESGVDFEVTPAVEQELIAAGATPELVAAARSNFRPASTATSSTAGAQTSSAARSGAAGAPPTEKDVAMADGPPVVTKHEIKVGGRTLRYSVTTGMMPLKNAAGETEARVFFMAYTADGVGDKAQRPLMFSFNGGPGSSSVWLHLGALGPRRVPMLDDGGMPPPPFRLVDNDQTWLDFTDLVFIDPVGTGYSRAARL